MRFVVKAPSPWRCRLDLWLCRHGFHHWRDEGLEPTGYAILNWEGGWSHELGHSMRCSRYSCNKHKNKGGYIIDRDSEHKVFNCRYNSFGDWPLDKHGKPKPRRGSIVNPEPWPDPPDESEA